MGRYRPGFERRIYLLRAEQLSSVRQYQRHHNIAHEVVAIRQLLTEGLNFVEIRSRAANLFSTHATAAPEPAPNHQTRQDAPISETA
jgi:hypothetical protein